MRLVLSTRAWTIVKSIGSSCSPGSALSNLVAGVVTAVLAVGSITGRTG